MKIIVDAQRLAAGYRLLYETLRVACFPVGVGAASRREERQEEKQKSS